MATAGDCDGSVSVFTEVVLVRHGETDFNVSRVLQVILDPALRERHLGDLQGLTMPDAKKKKPLAYRYFLSDKRNQELPGGGESLNQLHERCTSFLEKLARKHKGERIIVVSHGGVLRELYHRACPIGSLKGNIKNTSVNVIRINNEDGSKWFIRKWGDVGHLNLLGSMQDSFGGDNTSG